MAKDTSAEVAAVARIRAENAAANVAATSASSGSSSSASTHYGSGTPIVSTNPYAPSYQGGTPRPAPQPVKEPWKPQPTSFDPTTKIPSVGGYTSFITPSGSYIDAPTSQYAAILASGGKVAPFVPSRDREVVWNTPEQVEIKKKILENPQTVYASTKFYEESYRDLSNFGKISPQESVFVAAPQTDLPRASGAATPDKFNINAQFPNTPIEARTPKGYGYYTYPAYQAAEKLSTETQAKIGSWFGWVPAPEPVKEFAAGVSSIFTGLPAWVASAPVGFEGYFREQEKYKEQAKAERKTTVAYMFDKGIEGIGKSFVETAKKKPATFVGQVTGMILLGAGIKGASEMKLPTGKGVSNFGKSVIESGKETSTKMFGEKQIKPQFQDTPEAKIIREQAVVKLKTNKPLTDVEYTELSKPVWHEMGINVEGKNIILKGGTRQDFTEIGHRGNLGFSVRPGSAKLADISPTPDAYMGIRSDLLPKASIEAIAHESGHAFSRGGFTYFLEEPIAMKTGADFLKTFNKMYGTDIKPTRLPYSQNTLASGFYGAGQAMLDLGITPRLVKSKFKFSQVSKHTKPTPMIQDVSNFGKGVLAGRKAFLRDETASFHPTASQKAALNKGAAPFAERGVMGVQFGSKGYRPTGQPKPESGLLKDYYKKMDAGQPTKTAVTPPKTETYPNMNADWLTKRNQEYAKSLSASPISINPGTSEPLPMLAVKTERVAARRLPQVQEIEYPVVLKSLQNLEVVPYAKKHSSFFPSLKSGVVVAGISQAKYVNIKEEQKAINYPVFISVISSKEPFHSKREPVEITTQPASVMDFRSSNRLTPTPADITFVAPEDTTTPGQHQHTKTFTFPDTLRSQKLQPSAETAARTLTKPRIPKKTKSDEQLSDALDYKFSKPTKEKKQAQRKGDPWYPASLESVTLEEFALKGKKRATHIASKSISQKYMRRLAETGQSIPTLAQSKMKSKKQKSIWRL